jgi:ketosteroid isomerase-like protein
MTHSLFPAVLAATLSATLFAAPAQAQTDALPFEVIIPDFTEDRQAALEVAATRNEWRETFERQDVDGMMEFYVPDNYSFDLMAAPEEDGLKLAFEGEQIWRQNWVTFFEMFEDDLRITFDDMTVYQSGDLATVQFLTRVEGTTSTDQYIDMWARETNVLRRIEGEWLLVHDHVSVPMDFATGQAITTLLPDSL